MELLGFLVAVILIFWLMGKKKESDANDVKLQAFLDAVKTSKYSHHFKHTGIGICPILRQLHLYDEGVCKVYDFADVREWSYNFSNGGVVVGTGVAAAAALAANNRQNVNDSGLFIKVRDVEHPKWQIRFQHNKHTEKELSKWMEILNQSINDDGDAQDKKNRAMLEESYRRMEERKN